MKHKNIFVACDTSNLSEIKKIIKQTQTNKLKQKNLKLFQSLVCSFFTQRMEESF